LKAMAGTLSWVAAAEIIGVTDRTMRHWRERWQKHGYSGLWDYRKRRPSPKRETGLVRTWNKPGSHRKHVPMHHGNENIVPGRP
jgi:transposase